MERDGHEYDSQLRVTVEHRTDECTEIELFKGRERAEGTHKDVGDLQCPRVLHLAQADGGLTQSPPCTTTDRGFLKVSA